MCTTNRSIVIADGILDLGRLGARVLALLPDDLAGDAAVELTPLAAWTTQAVKVRQARTGGESELANPASAAAGTRLITLPAEDIRPGMELSIGADAAETGVLIAVRVVAVVA